MSDPRTAAVIQEGILGYWGAGGGVALEGEML